MGNLTSSALTLSTGAPQGCVLSPLLYALFTYDCEATCSSNAILKFADDTTILGLISNNDETAYREEIGDLASWCGGKNCPQVPILSEETQEVWHVCQNSLQGHN